MLIAGDCILYRTSVQVLMFNGLIGFDDGGVTMLRYLENEAGPSEEMAEVQTHF